MHKTVLLAVLLLINWGCKTSSVRQETAPAQPVTSKQSVSAAAAPAPEPVSAPLNTSTNSSALRKSNSPSKPQAKQTTAPENSTQTALHTSPASQPLVLPPDTPVFEDEEIINPSGRLLNPYAYLTPNPQARTGAPWDGEQLKYGIYYTFIRAGTAYIRNRGVVDIAGRSAYLIQTTAFSAAVIDAFFKVRDLNQSWIDTQNFYSRGYGQSVREGSYKRDEWVHFSPEEKRYYGQIQKKDPSAREISGSLNTQVADFLSSLYFVRAQPLEIGKDVVFDIVNREKQYPLIVKVLRKEKIKTPAGEFNCIVVEPQLRGEGIFVSKGKSLTVWLTDDEYRMPIKMKAEVFIGSVSASLLEYKRL